MFDFLKSEKTSAEAETEAEAEELQRVIEEVSGLLREGFGGLKAKWRFKGSLKKFRESLL